MIYFVMEFGSFKSVLQLCRMIILFIFLLLQNPEITMQAQFTYDEETKWLYSGGEIYDCPPGGLGKALFDKIQEFAGKGLLCQIDGLTGKEETYEEFLTKCIKIALYMKDQGLKAGDIIAMCSQNNAYNLSVLIAGLFNGIILASTDPMTSTKDSKYLLGLVEPKLMFVCKKSIEVCSKATEEQRVKIITLFDHDSHDNIPAVLEKYTEDDIKSFVPYYANDLSETISIQFSSGTTGMPKASCFNHNMLFENTKSSMVVGLRGTIFTTLYWSTTIALDFSLILAGGVIVYIEEINPETVWDILQKTKCNLAFFSYGFCMQCLPHLNQPLPYVKVILVAGGKLPNCYYNDLKEKLPGIIIHKVYGATEIGATHFNIGQCSPESAGFLRPKAITLKISDLETEEAVGLNILGEIRIKGKNQLNGYYKRDSSDLWDYEGFYKTGDVGYLNDKYELIVVDRIKEMFKYRGYHVVPEKIEKVLLTHPAVKLAIVIRIPHLTDDSHAKGLVVLRDGYTISSDELVKFTNDNIEDPRDHLRAGIQFIDEEDIPYTPTNKINRRLLKEKVAQY